MGEVKQGELPSGRSKPWGASAHSLRGEWSSRVLVQRRRQAPSLESRRYLGEARSIHRMGSVRHSVFHSKSSPGCEKTTTGKPLEIGLDSVHLPNAEPSLAWERYNRLGELSVCYLTVTKSISIMRVMEIIIRCKARERFERFERNLYKDYLYNVISRLQYEKVKKSFFCSDSSLAVLR